ncbi:TPA: TraR/DksA C4-type zinc finger protein [Klebsiella pneumoniae]|nr:TraR/DksA C4-type zinc finger protein [Klebsiella pneumoniae]
MPEIIDQANELAELQREAAIAKCRINHSAVSATHCRDCGEEIPERRRELVAGCQRCAAQTSSGLSGSRSICRERLHG